MFNETTRNLNCNKMILGNEYIPIPGEFIDISTSNPSQVKITINGIEPTGFQPNPEISQWTSTPINFSNSFNLITGPRPLQLRTITYRLGDDTLKTNVIFRGQVEVSTTFTTGVTPQLIFQLTGGSAPPPIQVVNTFLFGFKCSPLTIPTKPINFGEVQMNIGTSGSTMTLIMDYPYQAPVSALASTASKQGAIWNLDGMNYWTD
jgi:hypothetical protein|tara:strand:- start:14 stop:628 length:615 start_codon:yes stop_codon:yes gene_type:complete